MIQTQAKAMEDHKENFVLVLAGYRDEMGRFLDTNPGLRSRFPIHIDFPDYTIQELLEIAGLMVGQRQYSLTREGKEELLRILVNEARRGHRHNGNARFVRNLIEKAMRRQAVRLVEQANTTREELMSIVREDIEEARDECLVDVSL